MLRACVLLCKKAWRGRGRERGKGGGDFFRAGEQFECLEVGEECEGLVGGGDNFP